MAETLTPQTPRKSTRKARRTPGALGTTQQLPSGRWRAFYRLDGRRLGAPTTFATKDEALSWLARERADRSRGTWRDPEAGRITLADYSRDWLGVRPDLAPRTADHYARTVKTWITRRIGAGPASRGIDLGGMHLADITPATVRTWRAAVILEARERAAVYLTRDQNAGKHPARVWAQSRDIPVAATGRLGPEVLAAWRRAGEPRIQLRTDAPESAGETAAAHAYRMLRMLLNAAVTDGLLTANPCQIKGAGQSVTRERGTATPAEVTQLAAHMPARLAAAVTLAAWSGLRYGELFALARRHLDIDAETVTVERALLRVPGQALRFGPTKTAKSRRVVHLPAFVVAALTAHLAEHVPDDPDALLFTLTSGAPVPNERLCRYFGRARAVIGRADLRWHDLRHTGATLAYRAGASVPEVQRRLGHTTMRAAQIYAHAADDSDRVLADRLNEFYVGADTQAPRLRAV